MAAVVWLRHENCVSRAPVPVGMGDCAYSSGRGDPRNALTARMSASNWAGSYAASPAHGRIGTSNRFCYMVAQLRLPERLRSRRLFLLILRRRITKESLDAVQRGYLTFQRVFEGSRCGQHGWT
jgi:hypothetical protein